MTTKEAKKRDGLITEPEYFGSKKSELEHLLGIVTLAKYSFSVNPGINREGKQEEFITRLEKAKTKPDYGHVDEALLNEVLELARTADWNNGAAMIKLDADIRQLLNSPIPQEPVK